MKHIQIGMARTLIVGLLASGVLAPTLGWSQTSLQHVEQQLRAKQQAAKVHLQQMDSLTDPAQLAVETRRHLHLTNDIQALLLERQTLLAGDTSKSSVSSVPAWNEPKKGAPGGYLRRHGKDPRQESRTR